MMTALFHSPFHGSSGSFHVSPALIQVAVVQEPLTESHVACVVAEASVHEPHSSLDIFEASEQVPLPAQAAGEVSVESEQLPAIAGPCTMHSPPFATGWYVMPAQWGSASHAALQSPTERSFTILEFSLS
jgi:hypothetical protein